MTWTISEPTKDQHHMINTFLEDNIEGFTVENARHAEEHSRRQVLPILPRNALGLTYQAIWRTAHDQAGNLVGAISSAMAYPMAIELVNLGHVVYARKFLKARRVISGIAVHPDWRGQGIGKTLLLENEDASKRQEASIIVGFMDDANGTPAVYQACGYTVVPHNQPMPLVGEAGLNEAHPESLSGHWFYKEI